MPSKNTRILSARVKDKTAVVLSEAAEKAGMTVPRLLDEIAEYIDIGTIEIMTGGAIAFDLDLDEEVNLDGLRRLAENEQDTVQGMLDYMVSRFRQERERSI